MNLISVIVPIYNTVDYISRCVESIQRQTYSRLEIILVDDGSTDGCAELCDKFKDEDKRIKVIHKQNEGQGLARNYGLKIATGEYVTFVDSDDFIAEEHIANLYEAISISKADVALGNHIWVSTDGYRTLKRLQLEEGDYQGNGLLNKIILPLVGADENSKDDVLINSSVSMNLYRMSIIKDRGIQFVSERFAVAEDFFFNLDFLNCASHVVYCKESGYFYCQNAESTCEKYNPKRFERTLNYYDLAVKRVGLYGLTECVGYRIERSFLMKLRVCIRHIAMSDLSRKEKIKQIKLILTNGTVEEVLSKYPICSYSFLLKLLTKMMKEKNIYGVYYLMVIREKSRNNEMLRKFTHLMGLSR